MALGKLIVREHRPYREPLLLLLAVLGLAGGGVIAYVQSDPNMRDRIAEQQEQIGLLSAQLEGHQDQNQQLMEIHKDLQQGLLVFEQNAEVDKQAFAVLKDELKALQEESFQLKEELGLYQSVLNSPDNASGLDVRDLHVHAMSDARQFRYKVVLTHFAKNGKAVKGKIKVTIHGMQGDEPDSHAVQDLTLSEAPDFLFEFRNFKIFEGYIEIPNGFSPHEAVVRLESPNGKTKLVEKAFKWEVTA